MNEKRFISMHDTQESALGKIEELRAKGFHDAHIYAVTKHEDKVSILRRDTDVHTEITHQANWFDKVRSFLSGREDVHSGLKNMGLSEDEVERHYEDVESGKILIYVDEEFEQRHHDGVTIDSKPYHGASTSEHHSNQHTSNDLEIDADPYQPGTTSDSHPGHHTADGLEVDSKPYKEVDPNHPVDPEQEKLDEETAQNNREKKLRGLDDRAYRNDVEDPDNVRRF